MTLPNSRHHRSERKNKSASLDTTALDRSMGYSLRRAQFSTYREFSSLMDKFDIKPSQYAVLVLVRANAGVTQSALSLALGIQKANFVSVIDRLEERGLIERRKVDGDRRSSALYLTRAGEVFVRKIVAAHSQHDAKLALRLGARRTRLMLQLLHEFTSAAID